MRRLAWPALLIGVTLALYAPSLGYGLIWDDPRWYGQAAGKSLTQLFFGLGTYQYYRPFSLLLNQQFIAADGRILAVAAHVVQLLVQLAAVTLFAPATEALGLRRWHARLGALAFALYPPAFQSVAWQAPQGPWAVMLSLGAIAAVGRYDASRHRAWLALAVAAFASALLFQESVLALSAFVVWAGWRSCWPADAGRPWPERLRETWRCARTARAAQALTLGIALVVGAYLVIWFNVPRDSNVTGEGRDPRVLAYFLQAAAWPIARALAVPLSTWSVGALIALFAVVCAVLAIGLVARGQGVAALIGVTWVVAGLLPPWVGLSWEYVSYGERLAYVMGPGVAVLWAGLAVWLIPLDVRRPMPSLLTARVLAPTGAALGLAAYVGLGLAQLRDLRAVYDTGSAQLAAAVRVLVDTPDQGEQLFVNFPDRYELRAPYYPLGFWGIVLAPVVQDLRDFAVADSGHSGLDRSLSAFVTGAAEREAWRYRVDMRGVNAGPEGLAEAALPAERVWLTDYLPGGGLRLRDVGDVAPATPGDSLATFGDLLTLRAASVSADGALELRWAALRQPGLDDAVFIHIWNDAGFVTDIGGDALGGLLPTWAWRPADLIIDRRRLDLSTLPAGALTIRVGVYNRATGQRYALTGAVGIDDALIVGEIGLR